VVEGTLSVEYLAALLSSVKGDKDKTAVYLSECRTLGSRCACRM